MTILRNQTHALGFPRMGPFRDLKKAVESYWGDKSSAAELQHFAKELRAANWKIQVDSGMDIIPVNDFSLFDQVLDHCHMFGAIPERYADIQKLGNDLQTYFAMGRGMQATVGNTTVDVSSLEMKKWFDTSTFVLHCIDRLSLFRT